jgi:hypothetical protein
MRSSTTVFVIVATLAAAALAFAACSPKARAARAPGGASASSRLLGSWKFENQGMSWSWTFAPDGSFVWRILGQTDMGGKPVEVAGKGSYAFDAQGLHLSFEKFAGLPEMLRSQDAAPGFDARTEVKLRFAGRQSMVWSYDSAALGSETLNLSRLGAESGAE